jgi:predicted nucleic acid-binding protein
MHVLALLGVVIGGVGIWYWRFKMMREMGGEIADVVGRVRGHIRTGNFRKKAEGSPLSSVEDPALAAAIFLYALANEHDETLHLSEPAIRSEIGRIVPAADLEEILSYAQWAARDVADARDVVRRFKPLWRQRLTREERADLVSMAESIIGLGTAEHHNQKLSFITLRTALGPEQNR